MHGHLLLSQILFKKCKKLHFHKIMAEISCTLAFTVTGKQNPKIYEGGGGGELTTPYFSHTSHLTLSNIPMQCSRISLRFKYSVPDLSLRCN